MVSSAWVGARKPHPRIYAAALAEAGVAGRRRAVRRRHLGPDVAGPLEAGFRPLYLRRDGHWPDATAPPTPAAWPSPPTSPAMLDLLDRRAAG